MAVLPQPFDPGTVEPAGGSQGMPVGEYLVRIFDTRFVPVHGNPQNGRLVLDLEILDGASQGYKGAYGMNLYHDNPKTVEIAKGELSAICYVIGVFNAVTDTQVLHGKPFKICVRVGKDPNYTDVWKVLDQHGRTAKEVKNAGPQQAMATLPGPAAPAMAPAQVAIPGAPVAAPGVAPAMAPAPAAPAMAPAPAPAPAPAFTPPGAAPVPGMVPAPGVAPMTAPVMTPPAAAPGMAPAPASGPPAPGAPPWNQPPQ